jgi:hypothetical protein
LPITYAIIGSDAARFAPLADLYRRAAQHAQAPAENVKVSIASPGFIGEEPRAAKDLWYGHWYAIMSTVGATRGFAAPRRAHFDREANGRGALFVGGPEEIAERIVALRRSVGHMRQFFQMDLGACRRRRSFDRSNCWARASSPWSMRSSGQSSLWTAQHDRPDTGLPRRRHHYPPNRSTVPMTWQLDPMHIQVEDLRRHSLKRRTGA